LTDLPDTRVADSDRERAVVELREHAVAGRLTLEEFSDRVDQAYAARTRSELDLVLRELPTVPVAPVRTRRFGIAVMGGIDWRGRLRLAERSTIVAIMGGANIDLRRAHIEAAEVTITAWAIMGGVQVILPPNVEADVSGFSLMGGRADQTQPPAHPAALVRIRAYSLMGGVNVRTARSALARREATGMVEP
jgi:Domain of unknown function (DUF1707)/Cell wall-active antibiotics response 4TMS YvqF